MGRDVWLWDSAEQKDLHREPLKVMFCSRGEQRCQEMGKSFDGQKPLMEGSL